MLQLPVYLNIRMYHIGLLAKMLDDAMQGQLGAVF